MLSSDTFAVMVTGPGLIFCWLAASFNAPPKQAE